MDKPVLENAPEDERRRREQATEWWLKLLASEPTGEDIAAWLGWHKRDPRNAEAFERARAFVGRIRATDPTALAGLVAEFSQSTRRGGSRWLGWSVRLGATLAVVTAVVVGYWLLAVPEGQTALLEFQTPVAMNRDVALPDGSSVVLGADSRLNASFTANARHVELNDGEAYFKVKHEEQRPFYVRAGKLTIRDVGTAFDVSKIGQRVTVTVEQGRVRVTESGTAGKGNVGTNTVDIGAGQQVLYTPGVAGLRVARINPAGVLGWREQRLEFVNAPLAFVIVNINRYTPRPLHVSDPAIGRLRFTGTVDLHNLDHWLAALQTIFPVRVEYRASGESIVRADAPHNP